MHILLARGGLNVMTLLGTFPSGIAQGMIWGIMALGVYITFRMLDIADLTVDGSFTTGGAVAVVLITSGVNCWLALAAATLAGLIAGLVTGILHTRLGIPAILSGILTQFALYSINLAIMGFSANRAVSVDRYALSISSRYINAALITGALIAVALVSVLYWYFGTEHGSAMRATGNNPDMSKALGININSMKVIGLAISNALVAFSGGLMAQYQGFADINMGRGAIVIGLAAVIVGEVFGEMLLKKRMNFYGRLLSVVSGGIIYYLVVCVALWLKINSNMLKLMTAIIVIVFLAVPYLQSVSRASFKKAGKNSVKEIQ
ncbi:MAG: ABC transporter permease [Bulleidia sp.]|nr:ABC transporter permease [Erysipelotrichaceae bacterium]MDD6664008.1 ABC transporter permease [Bulleidia sp.]